MLEQGAAGSLGDRAAVAEAQLLPAAPRPCAVLSLFLAAVGGKEENQGRRRRIVEGLVAAFCHLPAGIWGAGAVPNANPSTDFSELGEWAGRGWMGWRHFPCFLSGTDSSSSQMEKGSQSTHCSPGRAPAAGLPRTGANWGEFPRAGGSPAVLPRAHTAWQPRSWEMLSSCVRCGAAPAAPPHPGRINGVGG